jgi:uncharacterized membrane protein YfcA
VPKYSSYRRNELFVGLLIGPASMGGAALTMPCLMSFVGLTPISAARTDFVYSAVTKIAGGAMHWRRTLSLSAVLPWACGSIHGGLLGSYFAPLLSARTLRLALSVVLFASGVN